MLRVSGWETESMYLIHDGTRVFKGNMTCASTFNNVIANSDHLEFVWKQNKACYEEIACRSETDGMLLGCHLSHP